MKTSKKHPSLSKACADPDLVSEISAGSGVSGLSLNFRCILQDVAGVIAFDYFKQIIGQTHAIYLLVYLAGLIICGKNATMTAMERVLRACRHDSLCRLLTGINLTTIMLSKFFIGWITANRKSPGWLCLDDTVIEKIYSKAIEYAGCAWSTSLKRTVIGIHIVVLYWCDGTIRIPVGFRLWIPKGKTTHYRTKVDLAIELLTHNSAFCKTCSYIAFDSWYCSKQILRICALMGLSCSSRLKKNRKVIFQGREMPVSCLRGRLSQVDLPGVGTVLVCRDDSSGKTRYIMDTDTLISAGEVKNRYTSRWDIEECFRYMKQNLGLEGCQCRKNTAVQNHISLVFLAHFAMEVISFRWKNNPYKTSRTIVERFYGIQEEFPELKKRKAFLKSAA